MKHWQSTLALAALMIGLFGWLVTDIRELRAEVRSDIYEVRGEISEVRSDINALRDDVTALRERMARTEALILRGVVADESGPSAYEGVEQS